MNPDIQSYKRGLETTFTHYNLGIHTRVILCETKHLNTADKSKCVHWEYTRAWLFIPKALSLC